MNHRMTGTHARAWFVRGMGLILVMAWPAVSMAQVYWTGAEDNFWSNTNNWHGQALPGENDTVVLGDPAYCVDNRAYEVVLDGAPTTTVSRLHFAGTEDRVVTLKAEADQVLDVAGFTEAISMLSAASADAYIGLDIVMINTNSYAQICNYSPDSILILDKDATVRLSRIRQWIATGGPIEVRGSLIGNLRSSGGTTTILATDGNAWLNEWQPNSGNATLLLKTDSAMSAQFRGNHTNEMRIVESGETNRTFTIQSNLWGAPGQLLRLTESTDGSTGHLTLRIDGNLRADGQSVETFENSTVELGGSIQAAANAGITGTGHFRLKRDTSTGVSTVSRELTYTGRTMLDTGILSLSADGALPTNTIVEIGENAGLRVNHARTVGGVSDYEGTSGTLDLRGGALTVNASQASAFGGAISGTGTLVKAGAETWSLTAGYTNVADRTLRIAGGLLAVTGALAVENGDFELAGGRVTAGSLAAAGQELRVTLTADCEEAVLMLIAGTADLTGTTLTLALAGGYTPLIDTQYTLLNASTIDGASTAGLFGWDDGHEWKVDGVEFRIEYIDPNDSIRLTVIPEPGVLGLLALAAAGLAVRRRRA